MGDIMRPVPFRQLLERVVGEFARHRSIFGISEDQFYAASPPKPIGILGQQTTSPVGPAAGPHTQLAQNIVAAYLVGGRFIELKTVQKLDHLEIDKPCIDARDEGYNVEWSTEFTLEQASDEYIKAWLLLHFLEEISTNEQIEEPSCIFNMSVGYDLEGIMTPKMQRFIDTMLDASDDSRFRQYVNELEELASDTDFFAGTGWEESLTHIQGISRRISPHISPSVTLSTMHGCPPEEIEAICSYLLSERKINTFVKLNPTLLGFDRVRELLDGLGYDYLHISRESFDKDLQYPAAVEMLTRLMKLAKQHDRQFGIKLANTLGSINDQGVLPGEDMYMSGRALYPITITLAAQIAKEFSGKLPISYSGGVRAENIQQIAKAGIRPITLATDLLKPGGYARMTQLVQLCEETEDLWRSEIDVGALEKTAQQAPLEPYVKKEFRGDKEITSGAPLPLLDCYVAPCSVACPIGQGVPEYIYLAGQGRYAEALSVIYETNALPNITGYICDHQCMFNCTRLDYEGAVEIREVKKIAAENGFEEYLSSWEPPEQSSVTAAVVGAGPAGLSAAYFLARAGFQVTVFEREESAGGVVRHVIPDFRLPLEAIEADIEFIRRHGVTFNFGASDEQLSVEHLKARGYSYLFYAVGAQKDNPISLEGSQQRVLHALEFLKQYRKNPASLKLGKHVAVVGGGNTAMDSARAALTLPGVEQVDVLYRRTKRQMPADLEEYDNAVAEGARFTFLATPEAFSPSGELTCRRMKLGEADKSGRKRPEPTEETFSLQADTLITAIGEHVDAQALAEFGIPVNDSGWAQTDQDTLETTHARVYMIGDAQSGPSTVVQCIASARTAVEAALDRELGRDEHDHDHDHGHESEGADEIDPEELKSIEEEENSFFAEIRVKKGRFKNPADYQLDADTFSEIEASRCLECSYLCNKCVEVCPNRANVAVDVRDARLFDNPYQIVHIDAYCNECGNCAQFCPWEGKPYQEKFTIFSLLDDFTQSQNPGIYLDGRTLHLRIDGEVSKVEADKRGLPPRGVLSHELYVLLEQLVENYGYLFGPVQA
ncbi:MAG: putative selenate reductase subunit YgfK [Spirochaetota bacterium]